MVRGPVGQRKRFRVFWPDRIVADHEVRGKWAGQNRGSSVLNRRFIPAQKKIMPNAMKGQKMLI